MIAVSAASQEQQKNKMGQAFLCTRAGKAAKERENHQTKGLKGENGEVAELGGEVSFLENVIPRGSKTQ